MMTRESLAGQTAAERTRRALTIGVIGLGPRWQRRIAPALRRLAQIYQVGSVCDQVYALADQEARSLQCKTAAGPAELIKDESIDAIVLADPQWYGLWPLELALPAGKPAFCTASRGFDLKANDRPSAPVMMALAARAAPVTGLLRSILDRELGQVRTIVCRCHCRPGPRPFWERSATLSAIDWCLRLVRARPVAVQSSVTRAATMASLQIEFADGQAAQVVLMHGPKPRLQAEVVAERGIAQVAFPGRLAWSCGSTRQRRKQTVREPSTVRLLRRFHRAVTTGKFPSLADAQQAWLCLQAAARGATESRRIELADL